MKEIFQHIENNPIKDTASIARLATDSILSAKKFCRQFKIEEMFDQESRSDLFAIYLASYYISDNKYDMQTSRNNPMTKAAIKLPIIGKKVARYLDRFDSINSTANLVTRLLYEKTKLGEEKISKEIMSKGMSREMSIEKWLGEIVDMMDTAHMISIAVIKHETHEDDPQDLNNAIRELKISYMAKKLKRDKLS